MNEPKHLNTAELPWHLTSTKIAESIQATPAMIRQLRSYVFGTKRAPTEKWERKYGHLPWGTVDWANENDSMVAERFRVQPVVVRHYRIKNRIPIALVRARASNEVVDQEELAKVKWNIYTDQEIANILGVSRERARQLRMEAGVDCLFSHTAAKLMPLARWMYENRESLDGLHVHEVITRSPFKTQLHFMRKLIGRFSKAIGIKLDWTDRRVVYAGNMPQVNWELQNTVLSAVWGGVPAVYARARHLYHKPKGRWRFGGFSKQMDDPEFQSALRREIANATESGVKVDVEKIRVLYRLKD